MVSVVEEHYRGLPGAVGLDGQAGSFCGFTLEFAEGKHGVVICAVTVVGQNDGRLPSIASDGEHELGNRVVGRQR